MTATQADLEQLRGLAEVGANWAASALEQLAGRAVVAREPQTEWTDASGEAGPWETGMFVEVEGDLCGVVALLLTPGARDSLVRRLLGTEDPSPENARSALLELGNIIASQAVSAMANALGGRVVPSVPVLVPSDAENELAALVEKRGASTPARFESLVYDRTTSLRALLVFVPDAKVPSEVPAFDPPESV